MAGDHRRDWRHGQHTAVARAGDRLAGRPWQAGQVLMQRASPRAVRPHGVHRTATTDLCEAAIAVREAATLPGARRPCPEQGEQARVSLRGLHSYIPHRARLASDAVPTVSGGFGYVSSHQNLELPTGP